MKQVIEAYVGVWVIALIVMLAISFTSINMNVSQARRVYNDLKVQIQASNGAILDKDSTKWVETGGKYVRKYSLDEKDALSTSGFYWKCTVERNELESGDITTGTFIYNDIYHIRLEYEYVVPLFGIQIYPIDGYAY